MSKKSLKSNVIANQPTGWCGDPLIRRKKHRFLVKKNSKIREIATPVCALARNDMVFRQPTLPSERRGALLLCVTFLKYR